MHPPAWAQYPLPKYATAKKYLLSIPRTYVVSFLNTIAKSLKFKQTTNLVAIKPSYIKHLV